MYTNQLKPTRAGISNKARMMIASRAVPKQVAKTSQSRLTFEAKTKNLHEQALKQ